MDVLTDLSSRLDALKGRVYRFTVPGRAVPQARPRFTAKNGYARAYEPERCSNYKSFVRVCAMTDCTLTPENAAYTGPVSLWVYEYRAVPKSWSKAKREEALNQQLWPVSRPDTDNVLKCIKDALTGFMYADDAQVVVDVAMKSYSEEPCAVVTVIYKD